MNLFRNLIAASLLAAATPAAAQEVVAIESPRRWFFELQFGGYSPDLDEEEGLAGSPFNDVFGDDNRVYSQLSLERLLFKDFGSLGIGASIGYVEFYGNGFFAEGPNAGEPAPDNTSLHVVPLIGFAAYRFDWAAIEAGIPLVPYGKAGLGTWLWWSDPENGGKAGWMVAGGVDILLDFFDPRLSRDFDREWGVNNSYLFLEYTYWGADGFGGTGFDFSDSFFSGGLALEF